MNILDEVTQLLIAKIKDMPQTAYSLNKVTGINLSTANQIFNKTWNPTIRTLLSYKEKYGKK